MKMWVRMLYFGWGIDKKLNKQFSEFGLLYAPIKEIQYLLDTLNKATPKAEIPQLKDRYISVWNGKMSSMIEYTKESEDHINIQEAIDKLATGEIKPMDW